MERSVADGNAFRQGFVILASGLLLTLPMATSLPSLSEFVTSFGVRTLFIASFGTFGVAVVLASLLWMPHRRRRREAWRG